MDAPTSARRHPVIALLTRLLEVLLILAMGTLVVDVLWGVLSRMLASSGLLSSQSSWTEELARYLMIWVGLLGACLAFEKRAHLGVDYFVGKFHPSARTVIRLGALLVVLLFAVGALIVGGWQLVTRTLTLEQYTPALGIPKAWVYLVVPISGVFTVIFTLGQMLDVLRGSSPSLQGPEEGADR
jgi:TRAP-type C4-dicarboxylate transport system permease small subunit